jgi:hypothetical protein
MSLEAFRLRRLATKAQTYVALFCLSQLVEDVIFVILEYLEFARPDVSPKLVNDEDSLFDIYNSISIYKAAGLLGERCFTAISLMSYHSGCDK